MPFRTHILVGTWWYKFGVLLQGYPHFQLIRITKRVHPKLEGIQHLHPQSPNNNKHNSNDQHFVRASRTRLCYLPVLWGREEPKALDQEMHRICTPSHWPMSMWMLNAPCLQKSYWFVWSSSGSSASRWSSKEHLQEGTYESDSTDYTWYIPFGLSLLFPFPRTFLRIILQISK